MANEVAQTSANKAVATVPNLRKGQHDRMKAVRATISGKINLRLFEPLLGKKTLVDPALLKKQIADGQYTLECVLAEQKRCADAGNSKPSIADLVGTPGQRTQLREQIIALVMEAVYFKQSEVPMACLLRPGHPSLQGVNALLNGGALHLSKELDWPVAEWAGKRIPPIKLEGVGLDQGEIGGHVAEILAAAKAMAEEDVKRIAAANPQK